MGERTVLILTGEPSGDRAAGPVARALLRRRPGTRVLAVGGPALRAAGAEILQDIADLGAMGFAEVVRQIPRIRALESRLKRILEEVRPDVVMPVDYPGFNLRIARHAKRAGIPVVYYIGPQVWAWGKGRVPKIAAAVDRMLVVFPFEKDIYARAGVAVDFVGHPLLDALDTAPSRAEARRTLRIENGAPMLGLLPGSRTQEIRRVFPVMVEAAARLQEADPSLRVVASISGSVPPEEYNRVVRAPGGAAITLREGPAAVTCTAADFLLVTSGTATLEAALLGTPLAVLYRTSALTWFVGRRVVKIPRIALVNIVAEEDLAAEFLQEDARPGPVATHVARLLEDTARRADLSGRLKGLRERLGERGVAKRVAGILLEEAER